MGGGVGAFGAAAGPTRLPLYTGTIVLGVFYIGW